MGYILSYVERVITGDGTEPGDMSSVWEIDFEAEGQPSPVLGLPVEAACEGVSANYSLTYFVPNLTSRVGDVMPKYAKQPFGPGYPFVNDMRFAAWQVVAGVHPVIPLLSKHLYNCEQAKEG